MKPWVIEWLVWCVAIMVIYVACGYAGKARSDADLMAIAYTASTAIKLLAQIANRER